MTRWRRRWVGLLCAGLALVVLAPLEAADPVAKVSASPQGFKWSPLRPDRQLTLTVSGPKTRVERRFQPGKEAWIAVRDEKRGTLEDGAYRWELRAAPVLDAETRKRMAGARAARDRGQAVDLTAIEAKLEGSFVQTGSFVIAGGRVVNPREAESEPKRGPEEGRVTAEGDLEVAGRKSFRADDPSSSGSIFYVALEGPEAGTYFRGTGETVGGEAVIEIPDHFAKVTEAEGLTAQLTPHGAWSRLYVAEVSPRKLVVRDAEGGGGAKFSFLLQGVRRGYMDHDVERAAESSVDSNH